MPPIVNFLKLPLLDKYLQTVISFSIFKIEPHLDISLKLEAENP